MRIEAIIFDFDGLLMDTERCSLESWQREWRQHGLELDIATFFANHGGDITEERYALLAGAAGAAFNRDASHARRLAYRDRLHATLGYRPGIETWLTRAAELGLRLAVASSSHRPWVTMHLERVNDLRRFEQIACGDEVTGHKPDPAVYHLALERLGVAPERALAVEDTCHGVLAARAAGMQCVAIPNLHPYPPEFTDAALVLESASAKTLDEVLAAVAGATQGAFPAPRT
jgi:putative hydrolase of the HAD superfamily